MTLAMLRDAIDFRNLLLVERPNTDFGHTLMRQFLFDTYHLALLEKLQTSSNAEVAAIAAKSVKEVQYHLTRSSEVVIALGDGTAESHARMQSALEVRFGPLSARCSTTMRLIRSLQRPGLRRCLRV